MSYKAKCFDSEWDPLPPYSLPHGAADLLRDRLSVLVNNRTAFLLVIIVILFVKLAISAIVPASKDMVDIVGFAQSIGTPGSLNGPWIMMTSQILNAWRFLTSTVTPFENVLAVPPSQMTADVHLLLLLLRLPAVTFDAAVATTLYYSAKKITSSNSLARLTSLIWFLNPYTTFAVEMLGVPDVAAAFFALAAATLLILRRPIESGLALGAAIALKLYPILFLPQILFYAAAIGARRISKVLGLGLALLGLLAYYIWALELGLLGLRATLVEYTPVTTPMNAIFDFSPGYRISLAMFALILLYFFAWTYARSPKILLSHTILPALLVYYVFLDLHPQYLIWALPFLAMDVSFVKRRNVILLAVVSALIFLLGLLTSEGYRTMTGYSLLLMPLVGQNLPWYSRALLSLISDPATSLVLVPSIRAALVTTLLVYTLDLVRGWFYSPMTRSHAAVGES